MVTTVFDSLAICVKTSNIIIHFGSGISVLQILSKDLILNRGRPVSIESEEKIWKYSKGSKPETGWKSYGGKLQCGVQKGDSGIRKVWKSSYPWS